MVLEHLKLAVCRARLSECQNIFKTCFWETCFWEVDKTPSQITINIKCIYMRTSACQEMCTELHSFVYCHRRFAARWKWPQFIPRSLIKLDLGYREDAKLNILKTLTVKRFLSKAALVHPDHDFPTSLSHGLLLLLRKTNACVSVSVLWGFLFSYGVYNDLLR